MTPTAPKGGVARCTQRVMNLAHFLDQAARRFPEEIGFVQGEHEVTWAELGARVASMAAALRSQGVGKGDRVLVQSKNCQQLFESMFVCFRLGAVWVPTNYRQTPDEVAYLAEASGACVMICHADFPEHVEVARARSAAIRQVIAIGEAPFGDDYDQLVAAHAKCRPRPVDVEHNDPCWFFFTSGTTGRPKAAVLTHGQMGFVVTNHLCDLMPGTTHRDASLVVAPLSHGAGIHQLVQTARAVKTVLLPTDKFDVAEAYRLIEQWRVTNLFTVPTITRMLADHPAADAFDHSSLRYVIYAGAPMYREDQKRALAKLGNVLVQYFGLGEVTGAITVLPPDEHEPNDDHAVRIGTCGVERTGMHVQIQNDLGEELRSFETGEICVCGVAVFAGYYNNPEANAKSFRNGWFRTGDLGHMDDQGFVYITGRASDMYISGGSNVYPREIVEKVLQHPAVAEVAIVGLPDPTWGEVGIAVCVLREGASLQEEALLEFLKGKVAKYKMPKAVYFWDSLPKSGYGKIAKRLVKDEMIAKGIYF